MKFKLTVDKIAELLNRSSSNLDDRTLDGLRAARINALKHQRTEARAPVLAWLTQHGLLQHRSAPHHRAHNLGMAALLVALLFSGALYIQQQSVDHDDDDIAILVDDMPIEAYLDQ